MSIEYVDWECPNCGLTDQVMKDYPVRCRCEPRSPSLPVLSVGKPGGELKKIIPKNISKLLASKKCGCDEYAKQMDQWGIEGCEERFEEIVNHLVTQAGWVGKLAPKRSRDIAAGWLRNAINAARANVKQTHSIYLATSLSPKPERIDHQLDCLKTWHRIGLPIAAVQLPEEIKTLRNHFPFVEFIPTYNTHRKRILINDIADVASIKQVPIVILNSDLELLSSQDQFIDTWIPEPNEIVVGARWNYANRIGDAVMEPDGLDAFSLTPEMAADLPRLPFAIGIPFWDYWLPFHFRAKGYSVRLERQPCFFHQRHKVNWSPEDWNQACEIFLNHYQPNGFDPRVFRASLGPQK